jgi:hypothetical protein
VIKGLPFAKSFLFSLYHLICGLIEDCEQAKCARLAYFDVGLSSTQIFNSTKCTCYHFVDLNTMYTPLPLSAQLCVVKHKKML